MCGIAGFISKDVQRAPLASIQQMRSSILYRGPDEQKEWCDKENVYLFHSRLSIIDLSTGSQPMWDASRRYVIVFNGEIYNYKELRSQYEKAGYRFQTQSDTEVLLAGYALKHEKVCADLNGMFAFAIWDTQKKELFLARDHLGKKPLFWCEYNDTFYFSSTLDSFQWIPGWQDRLSSSSIALFSLLGSFPEDKTIYENAYALPYASYAFVTPGKTKPSPQRYWRMNFLPKSKGSLEDHLKEYENILINALAIRLRSDVPLALSFSGGVDSGTLAALCVRKLKHPVRCYTIDYHTEEDPSEETRIAKKAAAQLNLELEHIHFDYHHDLLRDLPKTYQYYDQPSHQLPLVYSHRLFEAIKSRATVVISGNGCDELFTGYIGDERTRQKEILLTLMTWAKPFAKALFNRLPQSSRLKLPAAYFALPVPKAFEQRLLKNMNVSGSSSAERDSLIETLGKITQEAFESHVGSLLDLRMFMDLTCSTVNSNYRTPDISGLAAHVEVRSPYLDLRLVEFAATLNHNHKIGNPFSSTLNKYLPKLYYEKYVSKDIAWSQKKGMGYNLRYDLSIKSDPTFLQAFESAYRSIEERGYNADAFRQAWTSYRNSAPADTESMMRGFMLGAWLQRDRLKSPTPSTV